MLKSKVSFIFFYLFGCDGGLVAISDQELPSSADIEMVGFLIMKHINDIQRLIILTFLSTSFFLDWPEDLPVTGTELETTASDAASSN